MKIIGIIGLIYPSEYKSEVTNEQPAGLPSRFSCLNKSAY